MDKRHRFLNFGIAISMIGGIVLICASFKIQSNEFGLSLLLLLAGFACFGLSIAFATLKAIFMAREGASIAYGCYEELSPEDQDRVNRFGMKVARCAGKLTLGIARDRLAENKTRLGKYEKYRKVPIVGRHIQANEKRLKRYERLLEFVEGIFKQQRQ